MQFVGQIKQNIGNIGKNSLHCRSLSFARIKAQALIYFQRLIMADQLFGCKCKERLLLTSPSSCPSPPKKTKKELQFKPSPPMILCVSTLFESMSLHPPTSGSLGVSTFYSFFYQFPLLALQFCFLLFFFSFSNGNDVKWS